jgi:hypothetical protein
MPLMPLKHDWGDLVAWTSRARMQDLLNEQSDKP